MKGKRGGRREWKRWGCGRNRVKWREKRDRKSKG
jgi:hypothetical protein